MPVLVVDSLEVIDVGHQHGQWPAEAPGSRNFARKLLLEVVPASGARQFINSRQHAVVAHRQLQRGRKIGDAACGRHVCQEVLATRIA